MEIERQVPFMILPKCIDDNGKTIFRERKYIADFFIIKEIPGQIKREYVIDAKGFRTTEYKLKKHMLFTRHGIYIEER